MLSTRAGFFTRWRMRGGHYQRKLATFTAGAAYVSRAANRWRRVRDLRRTRPVFPGHVALVGHVFYPELLPELLACLDALPQHSNFVLTLPPERVREVGSIGPEGSQIFVEPVVNRGRDIGPFLTLLNRGLLEPYAVVLKLHTKRSPHLRDGALRRRLLFTVLAGSRRHAGRALKLFEDPTVGMVGWRAAWRHDPLYWMQNRATMASLCERMGIVMPTVPAFFEGSMFWVRPAALRRLRDLALEAEDFEPEQGQLDGALHHAIERLFAPVVAAAGFSVCDLSGRVLLSKA